MIKLIDIDNELFEDFGKVVDYDILSNENRVAMSTYYKEQTEAPAEGNVYQADDAEAHGLKGVEILKKLAPYDEAQVGYCHGNSTAVNALEWHEGSEVFYAATPCVLYLGHPRDLVETEGKLTFDTEKLVAVSLKAGDCIMLDSGVLHFAPVKITEEPFRSMIMLPKGTNTPLESKKEGHLFMNNKWLIAHGDRQDLVDKGAWPGVLGKNYDWKDVQ